MRNISKLLFGCLVAAALALPASAQITLSLSPTTLATIAQDGTASYNLNISGLRTSADYSGPVLSGFAVQLDYNSTIASVQSVSFGTNLGSGDSQGIDQTQTDNIYLTDYADSSAATTAALQSSQPSSFTLATITFKGLTPGTTALTIDANLTDPISSNSSLTDLNAHTLDLAKVTNSSLIVTAIPEPSVTASIFGAAVMGFCMLRRRCSRVAKGVA